MTVSGSLARPMLAGIFIYGGVDALRDPESKAKAADDVAPMIAAALQLPTTDTVTLVRINGAIQVAAGTMLALGKGRRVSALVLAASLIPTTYAGHRFWDEVDEERRAHQRTQFLKNAAMLGGLVLAAGDTGGRATLPWQARRAAKNAATAVAAATSHAADVGHSAIGHTATSYSAVSHHGGELADRAQQLTHAVKESDLTTGALKAARKAAKKARKAAKKAHVADHARAAATKVQRVASDAAARAWEATPDGATNMARGIVERAGDALPVGS